METIAQKNSIFLYSWHQIQFNSFHFIHDFFPVFFFYIVCVYYFSFFKNTTIIKDTSRRMAKDSLQDHHLRHNTDVCLICSLWPVSIMTYKMKFRETFLCVDDYLFLFSCFSLIHYIHLICVVFFLFTCIHEWMAVRFLLLLMLLHRLYHFILDTPTKSYGHQLQYNYIVLSTTFIYYNNSNCDTLIAFK